MNSRSDSHRLFLFFCFLRKDISCVHLNSSSSSRSALRGSSHVRTQKDQVYCIEGHLSVTQAMVGRGQHCHPGYRRRRPASVADAEKLRRNHKPALAPAPQQQLQQRHRRYCWSARGILTFYCLSLAFAEVGALARLGFNGAFRSAAGAGAVAVVAVACAGAGAATATTTTAALGEGEHEGTRHQQHGEQEDAHYASSYLGSSGMPGGDRAESRRLSGVGEKAAASKTNGRMDMDSGGEVKKGRSSSGVGAEGDGSGKVVQER